MNCTTANRHLPKPALIVSFVMLLWTSTVFTADQTKPVSPTPASKTMLKAGFAECDITPSIGMEQPGGYGKSFHRVFHDSCKVRAAVFDDGITRVALVGVDSLFVMRAMVIEARRIIQQKCGIAPEAVLIGASHSHSSGPTGMTLPGDFDHASALVKELAYEKSSCADAGYVKHVIDKIVSAVVIANDRRVEARCGFGRGIEDKAAYNRRIRMKSGVTYTHSGKNNPDNVEYADPIDPEVGVIGAWDLQGKLLGCIVNYACHATTSPGGISANWIYYMEKTIRGALSTDMPVVFLQGCCGDITQVDNLDPHVNPAPEKWAHLVGGRVGAEAVKVLLTVEQGIEAPLAAKSKILNIKRRIPSPERVKRCLEIVQQDPKKTDATEWTFAKEIVLLDAIIKKQPTAEVEIQAVQVGPAVFITNPAEFFVRFGLDLKKGSPFPFTWPVELANGCVGYVPTEEALGPKGGGYETRLTGYSNLEPSAGRQFVEAGLELARGMTPGKVPEPALAPQGKPWSYGNLPPELQ